MMKIWADGGKNDRIVRIAVVKEDKTECVLGLPLDHSHNAAEYLSLKAALERASNGDSIYMDSKLVVEQVNNRWNVKEPFLRLLHGECSLIMLEKKCKVLWIPRDENRAGILLEKIGYFDKHMKRLEG